MKLGETISSKRDFENRSHLHLHSGDLVQAPFFCGHLAYTNGLPSPPACGPSRMRGATQSPHLADDVAGALSFQNGRGSELLGSRASGRMCADDSAGGCWGRGFRDGTGAGWVVSVGWGV